MEAESVQRLHIVADPENRISLTGELDAKSSELLVTALTDADPSNDVLLDCSALSFVDSSGLRVLLEARSRWAEAGNQVVVERPSTNLLRLLEITGLADHFGGQS